MKLSDNYAWLEECPLLEEAPLIEAALPLYGVHEAPGAKDNPDILKWATDLGITDYKHDAEPWCGLFMAYVAKKVGETSIPDKPLWALSWRSFGKAAVKPGFGDVLIFKRTDPHTGKVIGGHVGLYIGEDETCFHVLGGNESDSVTITRIPKGRLVAARRSFSGPDTIEAIILPPSGALSVKEV